MSKNARIALLFRFRPFLELLEERVVPDDNSAGPNGILARGLQFAGGGTLNGLGIGIGQVEIRRPGKPNAPIHDAVPQFAHADAGKKSCLSGFRRRRPADRGAAPSTPRYCPRSISSASTKAPWSQLTAHFP